jgi:hypothetical protein
MSADNRVATDLYPIEHRYPRTQPGVISNHNPSTDIHRLLD